MPVEVRGSSLSSNVSVLPEVAVRGKIAGGYERLKPGPGKSHETVASHQRARIHRAMIDLAAEGGRRGITVRRLAKLAGVSTATFYALFDGVDDCLLSASATVTDGVIRRIRQRRTFQASRLAQGERTLRALVDGFTDDPAAARLTLIESFGGGPAALGTIRVQEASIEAALHDGMSRRNGQVSRTVTAWIAAGSLQAVRSSVGAQGGRRHRLPTKDLFVWARSCLIEPDDAVQLRLNDVARCADVPLSAVQATEGIGETEVLSTAVEKLARTEGYWKMSEARLSQVAGVPITHFRRHFGSVDEAYLNKIDEMAHRIFGPLLQTVEASDWTGMVCRQVAAVAEAVEADETAAQLVLEEILAPGLLGITRRERLLEELANTWHDSLGSGPSKVGLRPKTAIAGLWTALSRAAATGSDWSARRTAPTYAYLVLVPAVGSVEASAAVCREFSEPVHQAELGWSRP